MIKRKILISASIKQLPPATIGSVGIGMWESLQYLSHHLDYQPPMKRKLIRPLVT